MADMDELTVLRKRARRMGNALTLLALIASPVVVALVVFGLPVLGNYVVLSIAQDHGCRVVADGPHPCILFGVDMGSTVYSYAIGSLFGGLGNPLIVLGVISKILPFWITFYGTQLWFIATVAATILRRDALKRLRQAGSPSHMSASGR